MNSTPENPTDPEQWLEDHGSWLYRFALIRVQDSHTAEDLVQETLVSAVKSLHTFKGNSSPRTWLTAILRRRIADHFQSVGRRPATAPESHDVSEMDHYSFSTGNSKLFRPTISNREFESSIEREEFRAAVQTCIDRLPLHLRQAFLSRIARDAESIDDISQELELTATNLSVRLFRARLILRECLEKTWTS